LPPRAVRGGHDVRLSHDVRAASGEPMTQKKVLGDMDDARDHNVKLMKQKGLGR
jgi:hypothetical protein